MWVATGVHAEWLAADGHAVHLVDIVPSHVEVASATAGVTAEVGDARRLPAEELRDEVVAAGFGDVAVYGVEGPTWAALDVAGTDGFEARVNAAVRCARLVERDPLLVNAGAHFLAFGRA